MVMNKNLLSTLVCILIPFPTLIHGQDPGSCEFNYGVYSQVSTMPVISYEMASGVIDGKIYLATGAEIQDGLDVLLNHLSIYDPETNTWDTMRASIPVPRMMNGAMNTVLDGKLYIIGGAEWLEIDNNLEIIPYARVDVYDPQSDTWEQKANLPVPLGVNGVCSLDGKIYVTGGGTNENTVLNSFYSYDPASDQWEELTEMTIPRGAHISVALDSLIYAIGGGDDANDVNSLISSCEVYDPVSDQWTPIAPIPKQRAWFSGCVMDGEIYIFGGLNRGDFLDDAYKYNPEEDRWIRIDDLVSDRSEMAAVSIGRTIYLIGGRTSAFVISPLVETYKLSDIRLDASIPDDTISGDAIEVDLSEYFSHVDGGEIAYSVCLDDPGILEALVEGSILTVTGVATGDAEVSILAESGEDQMGDSFQVNVLSTGIDETCEIPPALQIYPNPANVMATLAYTVKSPGMVHLEVSDLTGKRISVPLNKYHLPGEYEYRLNTSDMIPGIYFCRLHTSSGSTTVKLMVEH
jgi:N-acetylneuraminic acid mutarotase